MTSDAKIVSIIYAWERRRLTYNAVLFAVGVVLVVYAYRDLRHLMSDIKIVAGCAGVAVAANLAYFAGPVAEIYSLVFLNREWLPPLRNLVFALGMAFSLLVFVGGVLGTLFTIGLSNQ